MTWKRVVAGFRNQYDFAFNRDGELFTFDSDMEWDVGLPWYRPVRVNHCPLGAEFGWRNGSGKWPAYDFDSLPATLDMGRGSPTGVTFYQARQFPETYRDRMLICDWSQGRILAVKLERSGASYKGSADELVSGQPLNCTDIEVGPEGSVYFTTGGRGTQGGLYRVSWKQPAPSGRAESAVGGGAQASFPHGQLHPAEDLGGPQPQSPLLGSRDPSTGPRPRAEAHPAGPRPSPRAHVPVRARARRRPARGALVRSGRRGPLAGGGAPRFALLRPVRQALVKALGDADPFVRRHACEALMQQPAGEIPIEALVPLLSDPDRFIRFAARVAIEHGEPGKHRDRLLASQTRGGSSRGCWPWPAATRLDRAAQDELLKRERHLVTMNLDPDLERTSSASSS